MQCRKLNYQSDSLIGGIGILPPPARGRGPACWEGANGAYRVSGCYLAGSKLNQFCKSSAEAFHVLSACCRKSRLSATAALDKLRRLTHVSTGIVACLHKIVGISVLAFGIVVMMIGGALSKKGIFGRIIGGFGAVYGFVGFASDLISYSRIMALGLTTDIIASVFNILATIALPSPIGFVLFIVVILVGHLLNLGINIIGTFVHASRLQYIEFFGKFYEDGGKPFRPLGIDTKHVNIIE